MTDLLNKILGEHYPARPVSIGFMGAFYERFRRMEEAGLGLNNHVAIRGL